MNRWKLGAPKRERLWLIYTREPLIHLCSDALPAARTLSPYPLQRLSEVLAAQTLLLALRKLSDEEVCLLLASTRAAEGHTTDLHLCATKARVSCLTAHLARF